MKPFQHFINKHLLFLLLICAMPGLNNYGYGQTIGDNSSFADGLWNVPATWERLNALPATWIQPTTSQGYPGQYSNSANVIIPTGHDITLNVSPANAIVNLTTQGTGNDVVLTSTATTFTWTGGGGNDNWSTGANWGGTAPTGVSRDVLVFTGSTRLTPNNDLGGMTFASITFNTGGFIDKAEMKSVLLDLLLNERLRLSYMALPSSYYNLSA